MVSERRRGRGKKANKWFKPLLYIFSICLSLPFNTSFFLNLLFYSFTHPPSMSLHFISSFSPNSLTLSSTFSPFLFFEWRERSEVAEFNILCLFAFKCQFKLCGLLLAVLIYSAVTVCAATRACVSQMKGVRFFWLF